MNNIGKIESAIRLTLAIACIGLVVLNVVTGVWGPVVISASMALTATALAQLCPIKAFFNISSSKVSASRIKR